MPPRPAELLAHVPLFALLDANEREVLAQRLDFVEAKAGETIFRFGDPGDSLFVLMEGEVELFFTNSRGERIVLELARAGDFFGETTLLDGGPRSASAIVRQDARAIIVDRGDLDELFRLAPAAALDMLTATGRRLRETTRLLRHGASQDINQVEADTRTVVMRIADWISAFSGSLPFLFLHLVLFAVWIGLNVSPLSTARYGGFDPYPFGLLTMAVSLEAIVLSVFVLLSQNRQAARERVRNDIEYAVNLKAELEVAQLHVRVDEFESHTLARLDRIERLLSPNASRNGEPTTHPPSGT